MKKLAICFLGVLLSAGCMARPVNAGEPYKSWRAGLLEQIEKLGNEEDIAVIYAALALQETLVTRSGYPEEGLEKYDLENPEVMSVETNLERKYVLVAFPAVGQDETGTAFTIFQRCNSGLLLIMERGFYLYHDKLVDSFKERSKDSATDYFERDSCRALVGEEYD